MGVSLSSGAGLVADRTSHPRPRRAESQLPTLCGQRDGLIGAPAARVTFVGALLAAATPNGTSVRHGTTVLKRLQVGTRSVPCASPPNGAGTIQGNRASRAATGLSVYRLPAETSR